MKSSWNVTKGYYEADTLGVSRYCIHCTCGIIPSSFFFELSGYSKVIALIATVNESLWEHLKLGFIPFLKRPNFLIAKGVCICVIPLSIVVLFYSYTTVLGHNTPVMDILIFVVAVIIGQATSYKILMLQNLSHMWNLTAVGAVIFLAFIFMVFTFYPPHLPLFRDPITGGYGIP